MCPPRLAPYHLQFISNAQLFWFSLNTSYNHGRHPASRFWLDPEDYKVVSPLVMPPSLRLIVPAGSCIASHHPLIAMPSPCLVAPAGCHNTSCRPLIAPPSSPLILLLRQLVVTSPLLVLSLCRPLVLSLRRLAVASPLNVPPSCSLVISSSCCLASSCRTSWLSHHHLSSSSHCTILSSSHCADWLLCCLSLRRPLVVALPLVVLSLHCPLVVLLPQLVVALPLAILVALLYHQLIAPTCCCITSPHPLVVPRAGLSSSRCTSLLLRHLSMRLLPVVLSSCRATSHCLIVPADCRTIISLHPLVALPFRTGQCGC